MIRRHNSKTPEQHKAVAKALEEGKSIKTALIEAGYSPKQAAKGKAVISGSVLEQMTPSGRKLIQAARKLSWRDREDMIIGRLDENIRTGKDKAVMSAKIMGSHKALNLWTAEQQTGVVILNAPNTTPVTVESLPKDTE